MSSNLTDAQLERIAKIETYTDSKVRQFDEPDADGSVHIEIIGRNGAEPFVMDANGRLHSIEANR